MRFALFVVVAALALVAVQAAVEIETHHFSALADNKIPTGQTVVVLNALAAGTNVANVTTTFSIWNQTSAIASVRNVAYGGYVETNLGASVDFPSRIDISNNVLGAQSPISAWLGPPAEATRWTLAVVFQSTKEDSHNGVGYGTTTLTNTEFATLNATNGLIGIVNALDVTVFFQCKNTNGTVESGSATSLTSTDSSISFWKFSTVGAHANTQCRFCTDRTCSTAANTLRDWATFGNTAKPNAVSLLVFRGAIAAANKATFPVSVSVVGAPAAGTGAAASLVASFAVMALLAILAVATPTLF